ncbi:unnamed protein product [Bursaphelenchus okinawaensis]|uniref:MARVEL domain-containing protein n=1 Tax=Bursaphelenchus okinawaensis TaxID=465554 RepID=A0A811K1T0_9BILA|nr:unnamed protein product [Bursaphelenchus okinawaensis]CAG9089300.1 unnamed protein product [Bursaphelenchus okinawaensis]
MQKEAQIMPELHRKPSKRTGAYGLIQDDKYLYLNPDWGLHIHGICVFFALNQFIFTISCWIYLFYIEFHLSWVYWLIFLSWFTTALVLVGTVTKNFEFYYPYLSYHALIVPLNTLACLVVFIEKLNEFNKNGLLNATHIDLTILLIIGTCALICNILLMTSYYFIYRGYKYLKFDCDDRRFFIGKHPV